MLTNWKRICTYLRFSIETFGTAWGGVMLENCAGFWNVAIVFAARDICRGMRTTTKYFDVQITDRFDQPHEPFWSRECSLKFGSGKFEGLSAVNSPGFFRSTCRLCFHLVDNLLIFWSFLIEHRDFPWPGWPGAPQLQVLESFATALTDGPALKRGTQLLFTLQQAGDGWQPWLQGKNWGS